MSPVQWHDTVHLPAHAIPEAQHSVRRGQLLQHTCEAPLPVSCAKLQKPVSLE